MQRMKFISISHRVFSVQNSAKVTCIPKYFQNTGTGGADFSKLCCISLRTLQLDPIFLTKNLYSPNNFLFYQRHKSTSTDKDKDVSDSITEAEEEPKKLSIFQRYRKMLKEYWYVLIPVHMATSVMWFGGSYYAASHGLDVVPFLEYISLPEVLIEPLRNSSLGHIAVASAIYKLATPARYMVTLGGTTFAVKFLTKRGLIRPAPTKAQIKTIIQNKLKKDNISEKEK